MTAERWCPRETLSRVYEGDVALLGHSAGAERYRLVEGFAIKETLCMCLVKLVQVSDSESRETGEVVNFRVSYSLSIRLYTSCTLYGRGEGGLLDHGWPSGTGIFHSNITGTPAPASHRSLTMRAPRPPCYTD